MAAFWSSNAWTAASERRWIPIARVEKGLQVVADQDIKKADGGKTKGGAVKGMRHQAKGCPAADGKRKKRIRMGV